MYSVMKDAFYEFLRGTPASFWILKLGSYVVRIFRAEIQVSKEKFVHLFFLEFARDIKFKEKFLSL